MLLVDSDLPGDGIERTLERAELTVVRSRGTSASEIADLGRDAKALIVQWAKITGQILDELPSLQFISRLGIGYDMIDVDAATRHGIAVANTPTYCIEEVASHTVAMIMALSRGLIQYDHAVRSGHWSAVAAQPMAVRPSSTTIGVVGFGKIGSVVARSCAAIGFNVIVADPYVDSSQIRRAGFEPVSREIAISQCDILTLHAPLTPTTRHLLNESSISSMRRGSIVVNTCRGELIDERALADALRSGTVGAAGIDVFASEPLKADSPLRTLRNVLLSPHAAWYSPESLQDLPVHAARNVVDFMAGRRVDSIVNPR